MDLTTCGLLVDRAEKLAQLYADHGNWNDVKQAWLDQRLSDRSTRDSAQQIYRVLTSRFRNAPPELPNPSHLPDVFEQCATRRDKAQILFLYLFEDDILVQYVTQRLVTRLLDHQGTKIDASDTLLIDLLSQIKYTDGSAFGYAETTTERWCVGYRSVLREIGVLEDDQSVTGTPPPLNDIPLLVALGQSYDYEDPDWVERPEGLLTLFQPEKRWEEQFERAAEVNAWEFVELHGDLRLQPVDDRYAWIQSEVTV
jgi:hypothetical protein